MKLRGACLTLSLLVFAPAVRAEVVVISNHQTGTRDCGGAGAVINGNNADLTLTDCRTLAVNGNGNRLSVGGVESMTVLGNRNTVIYASGGRRPKIVNLGSGNRISEGAAGAAVTRSESGGSTARARRGTDAAAGDTAVTVQGGNVHVATGGTTVNVGPGGVTVGGPAVAQPNPVSVTGSGLRNTYDCRTSTAKVTGDQNDLVLQNCAALSVAGNANTIDAGGTQAITVTGDRNTITWHGRGAGPTVSDRGEGNVVKQAN